MDLASLGAVQKVGAGIPLKNGVTGVTRVTILDKYMILNDLYGVTLLCFLCR